MCGIAGVVSLKDEPVSYRLITSMTEVIAHRGPDGSGVYCDGPVGLGHRRLAILDLSPAGQQPMSRQDGSVVITFNGEIYNYFQLKAELSSKGYEFTSHSDTEALLYAYCEWGERCVEHLNGMFAFAIWDKTSRKLFVARDRFGVKPLYWWEGDGVFVFASEIKAILRHPSVRAKISYLALNEYFTFQNIFSDLTLFEGVRLLPAGSTLSVNLPHRGSLSPATYWDYSMVRVDNSLTEADCVQELRRLMSQAVIRQLQSDVPVGCYLSGGMDSGAITAIAARQRNRLVTFTGGFDLTSASGLELAFDERKQAEVLSNYFKTEQYEVVMHAGDMEAVISDLVYHLEDLRVGQCYPNYYVARLASKFVKVVLGGAGGDELFAGYPWRYFRGLNSESPQQYFQRYFDLWQRLVTEQDKPALFNSHSYGQVKDRSAFEVFKGVFQRWDRPLVTNADCVEASLYFELKTFLHGLLIVEDKLSMAHSLEARVPFLDNDLVDFALRIPVQLKLKNLNTVALHVDENASGKRHLFESATNEGKQILRKALSSFLPPEVSERAKQGFSAPDATWFRGQSIEYINNLLRTNRARIYEYLDPNYVGKVLDEHCSGAANRRLFIWSLLSFEHLLQRYF